MLGRMKYLRSVDVIEQRFLGFVGQIDPPHRHRHHFGARSGVAARHFLKAAVLAGTHKQARVELASGDAQCVGHTLILTPALEGLIQPDAGYQRKRRGLTLFVVQKFQHVLHASGIDGGQSRD